MDNFNIGDIVFDKMDDDISFDVFRIKSVMAGGYCELICIKPGIGNLNPNTTLLLNKAFLTKNKREALLHKIDMCQNHIDEYEYGDEYSFDHSLEDCITARAILKRELNFRYKLKRKAV